MIIGKRVGGPALLFGLVYAAY